MSKVKTLIIAEIGVNHNGNIDMAKQLVDLAKDAGANAVKFQTFNAKNLAVENAKKAAYQEQTTKQSESQFDMLKSLELTHDMHLELIRYCQKMEILFLSSPFDCESVDYLHSLDMPIYKIPSGEITHLPYLRKIAKKQKPVIMSTGMATINEINDAMSILLTNGLTKGQISLLHCTTEYPCPYDDVNLNAMITLQKEFSVAVGYSDHTEGISVSLAAVAMGATIIEKHFTCDKTLPGPDHKASLNPTELNELVKGIRQIESAMGTGEKKPCSSEIKNIEVARKSIVANKRIEKGDVFSEDNLICKRPGNGISPMEWDRIIGTSANKSYEEDDFIAIL